MSVFHIYLAGWTGAECRLCEMSCSELCCYWTVGRVKACWELESKGDRIFLWSLMGTSIHFARYTVLHSSTEFDRKLKDKRIKYKENGSKTFAFTIYEISTNKTAKRLFGLMWFFPQKKYLQIGEYNELILERNSFSSKGFWIIFEHLVVNTHLRGDLWTLKCTP